MVPTARNFKILIIDDNETDAKVVRRIIAKDYKSIDVVDKSNSVDWKSFLKSNKFDLILLNYAAGSSLSFPEIKKIITADETIAVYVMIWQHEIEVGMKAVYQGAEGFVVKDKTYLNLKKLIQRHLFNYFTSIELAESQEINNILSEAINDGFFRFTESGEADYISDNFIRKLGFETDFEISGNVADLFREVNENIKKINELNRGTSFLFETYGKDANHFWFQVYVYKKFDLKNDTLYFEGVLKNVSESKVIETALLGFKKENELIINNIPLPIEVYNKNGKKISSNNAFSKMVLGTSFTGKESFSKSDVANLLKESIEKAFELKSFNLNNQKVVLGDTQKYFNISYFASLQNPEHIYAVYNDITESIDDKNRIVKDLYQKQALFKSVDIGFIIVNLSEEITDISEKSISILGKSNANYLNTSIYKFLDMCPFETIAFAFQESKRKGFYSFTANNFLKISVQTIVNPDNEQAGYIIVIDNKEQIINLEETSNTNADRINLFSDLKNIFLWIVLVSENGIKLEYCSKRVTDITGYSMNEIMEENSKLTEYFFNTSQNNNVEKIIKYLNSNLYQEKNFIDRDGNIKRVKIKFTIRKLQKTKYRVNAVVEDITELSKQKDDHVALLSSINSMIASEDSLFFKTDDAFVVQEIYKCSRLFEDEIALNDKFQSFGKIAPNLLTEVLEKSLNNNVISEKILLSRRDNRKFTILVVPYVNYSDHKFLFVYIKDITVTGNIRNDYNYYSKLFDSMKSIGNSLVLIIENDTIVFANDAMTNFVDPKEKNITGLNITELLADNDYRDGFSNKLPVTAKRKPTELLLNIKDKEGNQKACKFDISIISGTEYPERLFLIGRDETEKEYLRNDIAYRSELKNILSASETDAIIIWHDNEVIYHNKSSIAFFGYSDKEMRGLGKFDLFSPIQTDDITYILPTLFSDSVPDAMNGSKHEVVCKKKEGEEFYAKISVSKHSLFSSNVFVLIVNDISEKKQLEESIQNLNNKTDSLILSLAEGIFIFNEEYKIIYVNPIVLQYLDYSFEDIKEKRIFYFIKDSIVGFDKYYFEESPDAKYLNLRVSFIKKKGTFVETYTNIVPLRNSKSQFTGGILSMRDLTNILEKDATIEKLNKQNFGMEKQITSLKEDLEDAKNSADNYKSESEKLVHALGEKIQSTKSFYDDLDAANKQFVRLYTLIQSNLRSQISNIIGFSEFMNKVWNEITPGQQLDYFNILLANSKQASHTFDKILLLSKLASNTLKIRGEIINISTEIKNILESNQNKFKMKNIFLDYQFSKDDRFSRDYYFCGDLKLMNFVFNEILSNSLRYTKQNGAVKIELYEIENRIAISIEDNGIGIAPDKLNNIFDYNESAGLNSFVNKSGPGVSLFLVKKILELHGAGIEITSTESVGTKVLITLPLDKRLIYFVGSESDSEIIKEQLNSHYPNFSFVFSSDVIGSVDDVYSSMNPSAVFLTAFLPEEEFISYVERLRALYNKLVVVIGSEFSNEFKNKLLLNNIFTFILLPLHEDNVKDVLNTIIHN